MKEKGNNKGISLLVLVITVLVLFLLAGTTISMITGDGLLSGIEKEKNELQQGVAKKNETTQNYLDYLINGDIPDDNGDDILQPEAGNNATGNQTPQPDTGNNATGNQNPQPDAGNNITGNQTPQPDTGNNATGNQIPQPDAGNNATGNQTPQPDLYEGYEEWEKELIIQNGGNIPTIFQYGDYEYRLGSGVQAAVRYVMFESDAWWTWGASYSDSYGVRVIDPDKEVYGKILDNPFGKKVNLQGTFYACFNLKGFVEDFSLPSNIHENLNGMFGLCTSLRELPSSIIIPDGVKYVEGMFTGTRNMYILHDNFSIPDTVIDCGSMFHYSGITVLPSAFRLGSNVENINSMFKSSDIAQLPKGFSLPNSIKDMRKCFQ